MSYVRPVSTGEDADALCVTGEEDVSFTLTGGTHTVYVQSCYTPLVQRCYAHGGKLESDEEFDARWVTYFNKADIDAWELRKGMNTLIGYDLVPEPKILEAALRACRRLNDLASAIRILEAVKDKSGPHKKIYPYLIQELRPTLDELGISTPEELGMD
ncbi:cytochrome c oxidase subunit 5A, mitochondrial-like isoform X1 [Oncorhynchus keta]|uniref:cytochrome c oxidase subunit 5A, mitochondrial-like isoform X1 n=1 Tax=Oncorhynchus keta TaxID=8018 RepID=UPI0015FB5C42|nr:cytochrome c oxidase subunit 5A, mitochondrial-like isoform X1 [Oncorhynchus keta]XP_035620257.1 cytochrome c oxidase subunit 5A, mitochondrial-like isoform X1 [Oncorhynchus keta]